MARKRAGSSSRARGHAPESTAGSGAPKTRGRELFESVGGGKVALVVEQKAHRADARFEERRLREGTRLIAASRRPRQRATR